MDFYLIHGFTKLYSTTVNGYCYRYAINDHHLPPLAMPLRSVYRCVAQIRHIQYLMYSISSSWGNKLLLLFAYTDPFESITTASANPPNAKQ